MMVKRQLSTAEDTPPHHREFFEEMQRIVRDAGSPSVRELQLRTGISHGYIHKALRGPALPSVGAVEKILHVLGRDDLRDYMFGLMRSDGRGSLRRPPGLLALGQRAPVTSETDHARTRKRPSLSEREVEVLLAWLGAESKSEAAAALYITASTVNTHLTRIRAKYAAVGRPARSKANLFARAIEDGYTRVDDW